MKNDNESADHVVVVPYDVEWPARFESERQWLQPLLAPWLTGDIEHIGSTSVPGLAAKPVIDMMAPVASLKDARPAIVAASEAGYLHHPYRADVMHWFCKPSPHVRTHHLHLVPRDSPLWRERLAFRDALRADPNLAQQYAALKMQLAAQFRTDREAYTVAKGPFVQSVLSTVLPSLPPRPDGEAAP
ncbi:GrpB family protein [Ideonella sp. DXS29W]|uniref:GrpB family protein n=1 Tax=Ideonella lacteola TaxID=2984193 RepID=A0ABU9BL04_9BURK